MKRRAWVLLHRWVGLALSLFVVLSGLTGSLLAFDVDALLVPELRVVVPAGPKKDLDTLLAAVSRQLPEHRIRNVEMGADSEDAYKLSLAPQVGGSAAPAEAFLDPYTGRLLGMRDTGVVRFERAYVMPFVLQLHHDLALGPAGLWFMGLVALLWILMSVAGIYLALPRGRSLRSVFQVKRGASSLRLSFDLHRVAGLGSAVVLVVLAFSGLTMNWAREVNGVVNLVSPLVEMPAPRSADRSRERVTIESAIAAALARYPDHRAVAVVPNEERGTVRVRLAEPNDIRIRGQRFVFVDWHSGASLAEHSLREGSAGNVFIGWQLPLHSGQALGTPGRVLVLMSGLVPLLLVLTGLIIWLKKRAIEAKRSRAGHTVTVLPLPTMRQAAGDKR